MKTATLPRITDVDDNTKVKYTYDTLGELTEEYKANDILKPGNVIVVKSNGDFNVFNGGSMTHSGTMYGKWKDFFFGDLLESGNIPPQGKIWKQVPVYGLWGGILYWVWVRVDYP